MASTAQRHMDTFTVADTTDVTNEWEPFFGKPTNGPILTDPYKKQSNQNYALPDAYKGQSNYLGEIVNLQILTDVTWYTGVILPIVRSEDLAISWNRWDFDQHRTEIVPEESVSRLISSQMSTQTAAFVRSGIAFTLEHGFMKTERGRQNYRYGLRQIAVAVNETNNADVILALITCENANRTWEKRHGHYNNRSIQQRFEDEVDNWACTQKDEFGFSKLDAQIDENMLRYQGRADTWILPPKMMIFAKFQPHATDYYLSGKSWNPDGVDSFGTFGRNRVFIMRQYDITNADMVDLSIRERQIGSYLTMIDRNRSSHSGDRVYTSKERSILAYNEDKDDWYMFELLQAVQHSGIWNEDGSLRGITKAWNVPHFNEDIKHDHLLMKNDDDGKRVPIEVIGQMRESHLSTTSLTTLARTVVHACKLSDKDAETLSKAIVAAKNKAREQIDLAKLATLIDTNAAKSIDLDLSEKRYLHLPIPNNQYYGLTPAAAAVSIHNTDEFKRLDTGLQTLLPGSVFTEGRWAAPTQGLDGGLSSAVILQNLLGISGVNVWARKTAALDGKAIIAEKDRNNLTVIQGLAGLVKNLVGVAADGPFLAALAALFNLEADLKKYKKFSDSSYEAYFIYREDNDAADVATLNVETVQAFVLRTKLVDAAQQIVIRSLTANSKNGVKPATDRLNTLSDKLKVGNEGASVKPLDMWDRLKDFPEVIDQAASRKEIENAAGDGKLEAAKIQAGFGVEAGQVENTFLITPLVLSLTQTLSLLNDILSKAAADAHPEDFVTKLKFTISNPKKVNEPLLTLAQLRRAKDDLERNPGEYAHLSITTSAAASLPLVAELKKARAAQLGQGQRGQKRKRAPKFVNYRKAAKTNLGARRRTEDEEDDEDGYPDAMDIDEELERMDDAAALRDMTDAFLPDLTGKRFVKRLQAIDNQIVDPIYKLVAKIVAATPFNRTVMETFVNNNIILPLNFLIPRPHQRYQMHFAIKCLAGSQTGNTYMGHSDFIVGDDPKVKMHYGHYTVYTKAVVREPKNVYVAYDIFSARCLGGAGVKPIIPSEYDPRSQKWGKGDVFFLALPYETRTLPNPLDLSGHFTYYEDIANNDREEDRIPHYPTAARYNSLYGWRRADDVGKFQIEQVHHPYIVDPDRQAINYNTVCFHDEERYYDRHDERHIIRHTNTGHWAAFCYPGVKRLRNGKINVWERPATLNLNDTA